MCTRVAYVMWCAAHGMCMCVCVCVWGGGLIHKHTHEEVGMGGLTGPVDRVSYARRTRYATQWQTMCCTVHACTHTIHRLTTVHGLLAYGSG